MLAACGTSQGGGHDGAGADRSTPTSRAAAHPAIHGGLVAAARWTRASQGFRLRVRPSLYGRNHAAQAPGRALDEALRAARPAPLTLPRSMHHSLLEQLRCHAVFAPRKPRWNLEAWRPDVGYTKTVLAECNP